MGYSFISIPCWCNYKADLESRPPSISLISIPCWCNYKGCRLRRSGHGKNISIPCWCNYKSSSSLIISIILSTFQFHVGAIIRCAELAALRQRQSISIPCWCNYKGVRYQRRFFRQNKFQFHVGAIIRLYHCFFLQLSPAYFNSMLVQL